MAQQKPITKKPTVAVTGNKGIAITFNAIEGETVLNGIAIKKRD